MALQNTALLVQIYPVHFILKYGVCAQSALDRLYIVEQSPYPKWFQDSKLLY